MLRTLALSAVAAAGLLLMPGPATTTTNAAPTIAPRMAAPDSAVEQVRRGGGRGFYGGGRGFRGQSFRGGGRFYGGGRGYGRSYAYYGGRHRNRGWRRGIVIGAGIPFLYGGGYYGSGYYGGGGCGYYYRKWQRTGSSYWRHRYYECRY